MRLHLYRKHLTREHEHLPDLRSQDMRSYVLTTAILCRLIDYRRARRVRLDAELKSIIARRSETARVRDGRQAADDERRRAAQELGLPIDEHGRVHYPDAQLEYTDEDGRTGRVSVEVASGHYSASAIRAKARAGFVVHAAGRSQARVLRALGSGNDKTSIRGPAQRDPAAFEL